MVKQGWSVHRLSKTALRSGLAVFCLTHLGSVTPVAADCDCDACMSKPKCSQFSLKIPTVPCVMGNGLFDHFNRMAESLGANLHRASGCKCDSGEQCDDPCSSGSPSDACDTGCDSFAGMPMSAMPMQPYPSVDGVLLDGMPVRTRSSSVYSEERQGVKTPNLNLPATPPSIQKSPAPPAKPGNPFLDEARFTPKPSRLPSSIALQEVHIAKFDPKALPTKTASTRKNASVEASQTSESSVIHVGATVSDEGNSAVRFAR